MTEDQQVVVQAPAPQQQQKQKMTWSDYAPMILLLGSIMGAWVNVNGKILTLEVQSIANEKLNTIHHADFADKLLNIHGQLSKIKSDDEKLEEQIRGLEDSVTNIYQQLQRQRKNR